MIFHLRGLPFPHRFLIKFSRSFQTPSKTYLFRPLIAQGHQKVAVLNFLGRFWRPARFRVVPKIGQNRPSVSKKPQKKHKTVLTFADLLPKSLPEHSLAPFWLILDGFRMLFDGFWYHFSMRLGINCNKICSLWTSSDTKRSRLCLLMFKITSSNVQDCLLQCSSLRLLMFKILLFTVQDYVF